MQPTDQFYSALTAAYDFFNVTLFESKLEPVMFTLQRQKGVMGYFSPDRWLKKEGATCHEIAINPSYIANSPLIEVLQTLVHEQCHAYQYTYGKPSRSGYHNKQWADLMESVGLMPSSTGKVGGARTGQRMNDYPIPNGRFIKACRELLESGRFDIGWIDRVIPDKPRKRPVDTEAEESGEASDWFQDGDIDEVLQTEFVK